MMAEDAAQQVIAQNLANVSTNGYKQDVPIFKSFEENLIAVANESGEMQSDLGAMGNGAEFQTAITDFSQGPLKQTGNPLDLALTGNAFLGIQTVSGTCYSRDGALTISSGGVLVQAGTGLPVVSDRGTQIQVPVKAASIRVGPDGTVEADGKAVARIGLFAITMAEGPKKIGANLVETTIAPPQVDTRLDPSAGVRSGYIEGSNVNIIKQMVTMIAGLRAYEANSKALQSHDTVEDKSVNQIGKV
jgi:flagellar basal-body rod protein FlgG